MRDVNNNKVEDFLNARIVKLLEKEGYKDAQVLSRLNILHHAWEADSYLFIVKTHLETKIVGTNHGSPYILTKRELRSKIDEYQELIAAYTNLLNDGLGDPDPSEA